MRTCRVRRRDARIYGRRVGGRDTYSDVQHACVVVRVGTDRITGANTGDHVWARPGAVAVIRSPFGLCCGIFVWYLSVRVFRSWYSVRSQAPPELGSRETSCGRLTVVAPKYYT